MFTTVSPVCPTTDMARTLAFWQRLGFAVGFADHKDPAKADYAGVRRSGLELHLQTFTPEQLGSGTNMQIRVRVESAAALEALNTEWLPHKVIAAPLARKPWGNYELGFYDPDGAALFFYVET